MNIQPYQSPPRHWPARLQPWWVRLARPWRHRTLRQQQIQRVDLHGLEYLREPLRAGWGVLITPNHAFHYDSYCLLRAADVTGYAFYFMTAWQVFAMCRPLERRMMQWSGCFSVDRESTDMRAFRQSVHILQTARYPLVIFPEGDIYHTNDCVTPFRDGAAAIALTAARKSSRPIVCVPCALKARYVEDPMASLTRIAGEVEQRLFWHPRNDLSLADRIYRIGEGLLALKELEYFGHVTEGPVSQRTRQLIDHLLGQLELRYEVNRPATLTPERIKELRHRIIRAKEQSHPNSQARLDLDRDLQQLFLVGQLYSYPGNYVREKPTVERLAETMDKFEEDVLGATYPTLHAPRRVDVAFGQPVPVPSDKAQRPRPEPLTQQLTAAVQTLVDQLTP